MYARGHQPHVLVIDHTPEIQFLFQELLAAEPYRATILSDCPDTVDEIARLRPDIIIHDYVPISAETDLASIAMLSTDPRTSSIPLVICSATSDLDDVAAMIRDHHLKVIEKPFAIDEVLGVINASVSRPIPGRGIEAQDMGFTETP